MRARLPPPLLHLCCTAAAPLLCGGCSGSKPKGGAWCSSFQGAAARNPGLVSDHYKQMANPVRSPFPSA